MCAEKLAPLNKIQKQLLVEAVKRYDQLQTGKFTATFTQKRAQELWEEIAIQLNGVVGGSIKDWKQWRKVKIKFFSYKINMHCRINNSFLLKLRFTYLSLNKWLAGS